MTFFGRADVANLKMKDALSNETITPNEERPMKRKKWMFAFYVVALMFVISGCAGMVLKQTEQRNASSIVDYLYPGKEQVEQPSITELTLPLKVGVAFVPEAQKSNFNTQLAEKDKLELMGKISAEFKKLPFVKNIEIIPSAYLKPQGSFANLDQIRAMHGVDVIMLIAYEQVQHTDEDLKSISYWTIVGAYVFEGEKNDTSTMMDAAVYDIASRKMLFRAPGTSHIKGSATLVNITEQLRKDSLQGFHAAAESLIANLQSQLEAFRTKIKENPQEYKVKRP